MVAFVAGVAAGSVLRGDDGAEPSAASTPAETAGADEEIAALEEQAATLQSQVDELTDERDGLRESVTELEEAATAAAEAAEAAAEASATATPATDQTPVPTAPPPTPAPPADQPLTGPYAAGQFEFTDVQVSDDGIGGFALRSRVTNTGAPVAGVLWTATLFLDGMIVATLNGSAQNFAQGATVTAEFYSTDRFGAYDAVEFQIDGQY